MSDNLSKQIPQNKSYWSFSFEGPLSVKVGFTELWSFRITPARLLMFGITALAGLIIAVRLIGGLGLVSNLNDDWPWGLWIGFDVLTGVALAGGGYGTALIIHILHNRSLRAVSRSTMLTSLIGYVLVVVGLFIEIGRWWNFWVPFVSWGHSSVLFEVFWCISMYTVVQTLEVCEIITEKIFKIFHKLFVFVLPFLLILGVMLPTLHQSSLGELYVMMDGRLHPLWFSPLIFIFFFLSSFFVGPAMIAVESILAYVSYGHKPSIKPMKILARIGGVAMLIYLGLKFYDLQSSGELPLLWAGDIESYIFITEIVIGVMIPLFIVLTPLANTWGGLITYGLLTSFGVLFNRLNVVITGMTRDIGSLYIPAWSEFAVSIGLVCGGILVYMFLVENFNILEHE